MRRLNQMVLILGLIQMYFGCNDVAFDRDDSQDPLCQGFNQVCINQDGVDTFKYSIKTGNPLVDILFVNDNSGSMSTEQNAMGNKFPSFIQSLGHLDYRLMMITTDISDSNNPPRPVNQNGALQDGNLIRFNNSASYLSPQDSNVADLFLRAVKRDETLSCEAELRSARLAGRTADYLKCPSGDERGLYAINLALSKNAGLFRPQAHLAIVILSDEDERSRSGLLQGYELETLDTPESVVGTIRSYLGQDKTASAHGVIIRPGDTTCLSAQNNQDLGVKGFEGVVYNQLIQTLGGVAGSICSNDYGKELGKIGANIVEQVNSIKLACVPIAGSLKLNFALVAGASEVDWSFDDQQETIYFAQDLPPGTQVDLEYQCHEAKAVAPQ